MNIWFIIVLGGILTVIVVLVTMAILRAMKGSLSILPGSYNYNLGETINGELKIHLRKPVNLKKLIIGLKCEMTQKNHNFGKSKSSTSKSVVFNFSQPLDSNVQMKSGDDTYNFAITIPKDVSQLPKGVAGEITQSIQMLAGESSIFNWYLYAELQCEGVNLYRELDININ